MISYVVCSRISGPSGRLLADAITLTQGRKCRYRNQGRVRRPELLHVRFGSHRVTSENCLNKLQAVENASNKLKALQMLQESGVRIPPHLELSGEYLPVTRHRRIFRKNVRHAGNDRPVIVEPNVNLNYSVFPSIESYLSRTFNYDYCLQCIDVEKEFRVHVFKGNAFLYQIRKPREGDNPHPIIRSLNRGWRLVSRKDPPNPDGVLGPLAVKAVNCLGLDFGAVDVLMDHRHHYYVIEVNTAPGLNEDKAALYAEMMVNWSNNQGV